MFRLTSITVNSSCSSSDVKCIYISVLKFSNSFIFESFFSSIYDTFKGIDMKAFPRLMRDGIHSAITISCSVFTTLTFSKVLAFKAASSVVDNLWRNVLLCHNYNISSFDHQPDTWLRRSNS